MSAPVFGIDIGGTLLRVALADEQGRILDRRVDNTDASSGPQKAVDQLRAMMEELARARGWEQQQVAAAAVGVPGPTDFEHGILLTPPNLPAWHDVPLAKMLTDATGVPTHLQNDANLAAYGEFHQGAGQGARHMVFVTVSTGIGGGLIIDKRLYIGAGGTAGEVGHIVVDVDGPGCQCGARGCLETLASGTAIAHFANARIAAGENTQMGKADPVTAEEVGHAAAAGDQLALDVLATAGRFLGLGLGSLLNVLDPEVLVLGGGAIQSGEPLLGPMHEAIKLQTFAATLSHVRIVEAALHQDAGLVGAVEWARDHLDQPPPR